MDDIFDDLLSGTVKTVQIRLGKGKLYTCLTKEDVKAGDYVYIKGKDKPYIALEVKEQRIDDLPVDYFEMKHASKKPFLDDVVKNILSSYSFLRIIGSNNLLVGRDDILESLNIIIHKRRMKNAILVGEAGCGKTSIVEAFAERMRDSYIMVGFSVADLVSGTSLRGQLEEKIIKLFNDILDFNNKHNKKIIMFIDEIHMLISNGGCNDGLSIHDMLKPYLTNPNIIVIGATTIKELNSSIKMDSALMRRMTPLYVNALNDDCIVHILDDFAIGTVDLSVLELIVSKAKVIPNSSNPDISIEILDRALARRDVLGEVIDGTMIDFIINDLILVFSI